MDLQLAGTRVIVTGSTKGIGRAIAEAFLDEGASVALCARTAADVDQALGELRSRGTVVGGPVDAADPVAGLQLRPRLNSSVASMCTCTTPRASQPAR